MPFPLFLAIYLLACIYLALLVNLFILFTFLQLPPQHQSDSSSCHPSNFPFKPPSLYSALFPSELNHGFLGVFLLLAGLAVSGGRLCMGRGSLQRQGNVFLFPECRVPSLFRSASASWPGEHFVPCVICLSPPSFLLGIMRLLLTIIMPAFWVYKIKGTEIKSFN